MSRQTYRTEVEIISDILKVIIEAGVNGKYITDIVREAHLSYKGALAKIQKLIKEGILVISEVERNKVFVITEKGIKFYQDLRHFQELIYQIRAPSVC